MAGWQENSGEIKKYIASEDELWSLSNYFFSPSCKKTSTYKFGFFKSVCDSLFSGKTTNRGYEIDFEVIFLRFSECYWNLITKYNLRQMRPNGSSEYSSLETIMHKIVSSNQIIKELEFSSLSDEERHEIVLAITEKCKRNVIGAVYDNFDGILYGFSKKENKLWLNPVAYEFLLKHKFELEKLNYYAWAKYLEEINADNVLSRVLDKLEYSTPKRNDLSIYRKILMEEFETNTCFYCGKKLTKETSVDHVIPWKLVRTDKIWNFVLACKTCNSKKNDRIPNKEKILQVISRNEKLVQSSDSNFIINTECSEYSAELMLKLWNYAKVGGYREYFN